MKYEKMFATIRGTTEEGQKFIERVEFTMIPPKEGEPHYGTGYYMTVKTKHQTHLIDVRYEKTTDIKKLADRWIKSWYGTNAKEVNRFFPEPGLVPMPGAEKTGRTEKKQYSK